MPKGKGEGRCSPFLITLVTSGLFLVFYSAFSHLLLELTQLHWEMHFYWYNHSRQSLMYQ